MCFLRFLEFYNFFIFSHLAVRTCTHTGREREKWEKGLNLLSINHSLETAIPTRGHDKAITPGAVWPCSQDQHMGCQRPAWTVLASPELSVTPSQGGWGICTVQAEEPKSECTSLVWAGFKNSLVCSIVKKNAERQAMWVLKRLPSLFLVTCVYCCGCSPAQVSAEDC